MVARTLFYGGGAPPPEEEVPPPAPAEPTPAPAPEPAPPPAPPPAAAGLYGGTAGGSAPPPQEAAPAPAPAPEPQPAPQTAPPPQAEPSAPLAGLLPEPVNRAIDGVGSAVGSVAPQPLKDLGQAVQSGVGGFMGVGEREQAQRPGVRDVGESPAVAEARQAARDQGHAVVGNAAAPVDLIREGADKLGATIGRVRDDPGGLAADVGDALGGAADAVASDPVGAAGNAKDAAFGAAAEGMTWAENRVAQAAASRTIDRLSGQEPEDTLAGRALDTIVPLNERIMSDPALQEAALDAFRNGTTKQDGTFVEPGERAAWEAIYDQLNPAEQVAWSARTDPTFIPSIIATLGAGAVPRLGAKLGPTAFKVAKPVGGALKAVEVALDTVGGAGLNLAVPAAIRGVTAVAPNLPVVGKAFQLSETQKTLDEADRLGEAGQNLLTERRVALNTPAPAFDLPAPVTTLPDIAVDSPANRYNTLAAPVALYPDAASVPVGRITDTNSRQVAYRIGEDNRFQVDHRVNPRTGEQTFFLMENVRRTGRSTGSDRLPLGQFSNLDEAIQAGQQAQMLWQAGRRVPRNQLGTLDLFGNPWTPTGASAPLPHGLYANKFEAEVRAPLTPDVRQSLDQLVRVNGREVAVGDLAIDYQNQIDAVRAAVKNAATTPMTVKDGAAVKRLETRLGGQPIDWAGMTDQQADVLARELVAGDVKAARGLTRSGAKKTTGLGGKLMAGMDDYLTLRRNIQLYNVASGPSYVAMQGVGNAVSAALTAPLTLFSYLNPVNWGKARALGDGKGLKGLEHPILASRRAAGLAGNANLSDTLADSRAGGMGDGTWFTRPGRGPLMRSLGTVLANPRIRSFANMFDTNYRLSLYGEQWTFGLRKLSFDAPKHAAQTFDGAMRKAGPTAVLPLSKRQVQQTVADLMAKTGGEVTGREVRDALIDAAGGPSALGSNRAFWNFADRVGRDWQEAVRKLDKQAQDYVDSRAFSFKATNADEAAQRLFMFHYWMSRASMLYLKESFRHPWQIKTWAQGIEAAEDRQAATGRPAWQSTFVEFMRTPAGLTVAANPVSLLGTYFFFADAGGEKPWADLTAPGRLIDDGVLGNVMLNPLLHGAAYVLGALGKDANVPDLFGTRKLERAGNETANFWVNKWLESQGLPPVVLPQIDSRAVTNWLGGELSGRIPGTQELAQFDPNAGQRTQLTMLVQQEILRDNPEMAALLSQPADPNDAAQQQAARDLEHAVTVAMAEQSGPAWERAARTLASMPVQGPLSDRGPLGAVAGGLAARVSPFQIQTSVTATDEFRARDKGTLGAPTGGDMAFKEVRFDGPPGSENARFEAATRALKDDVGLGLMAVVRTQHPDWTADQVAAEADAIRRDAESGKPRPEWTQAKVQATAWDRYDAISRGEITEPLTVRGYTVTPENLAAMDPSVRRDWADAWADEQGVTQSMGAFRAAKEELIAANPVLQAYQGFWQLARDYPGGEDAFVTDLRRINPGYDQYLTELEREFPPGSEGWKEFRLSTEAFKRAEGMKDVPFAPPPKGNKMYPGVKQGQGLASYYAESREEWGGSADDVEATAKDLDVASQALAVAAQYGYAETLMLQMQTGDTKTHRLPTDVYNAVKAAVPYIPSGEYSSLPEYLAWLDTNPADTSVEAFFRETGGRAPKAEDPDAPLPTVPGESPVGTDAPPAFDIVQFKTGRAPTTNAAGVPSSPAADWKVTTNLSSVDFLSAPSPTGGVPLVKLPYGTPLSVKEKRSVNGETWVLVVDGSGREGWVNGGYLSRAA